MFTSYFLLLEAPSIMCDVNYDDYFFIISLDINVAIKATHTYQNQINKEFCLFILN